MAFNNQPCIYQANKSKCSSSSLFSSSASLPSAISSVVALSSTLQGIHRQSPWTSYVSELVAQTLTKQTRHDWTNGSRAATSSDMQATANGSNGVCPGFSHRANGSNPAISMTGCLRSSKLSLEVTYFTLDWARLRFKPSQLQSQNSCWGIFQWLLFARAYKKSFVTCNVPP
jgi:hypothetical protein